MEILDWILNNWSAIAEGFAALVALASVITGLTPTPADDEFLRKVVRFFSAVTSKDEAGTFKLPLKK